MALKRPEQNKNFNINNIEDVICTAINYLEKNQHQDGSVRLNKETRWQVWETVNAIQAVSFAKKDKKEFLKNSIDFLLKCQMDDGSFYYTIPTGNNQYCMETTATSIFTLSQEKKDFSKGIQFILEKQLSDGSWEIGIPGILKYRNWPSVTGFCLKTLLSLKVTSDQISKGINFLLQTQQADGSWGSKWMYYDTPYYPIHVILAALKLAGLKKSENYKRATSFIKENQNPDGSWENDRTDKPAPSRVLRTALALNSLLVTPEKSDLSLIEKSIQFLIHQQECDGHWNGGYFVGWPDKKEDIYATTITICALKKYVNFKEDNYFF